MRETRTVWDAAEKGDIQGLAALLEPDPSLVNKPSGNGSRPLDLAAMYGRLEAVTFLLDHGADVNAVGSGGDTALHAAANEGHLRVVEVLLARGADVNARNLHGFTPLQRAAMTSEREVMKALLAAGADLHAGDQSGELTSIHLAALMGDARLVGDLLDADPSGVGRSDGEGGPRPLDYAAGEGHQDVVELLISRGADVNATHEQGRTALHSAASEGRANVVGVLLKHGAIVDARTERDLWTPLHVAAIQGHADVVRMLLAAGADPQATDKDGQTALQHAELQGHKEVCRALRTNRAVGGDFREVMLQAQSLRTQGRHEEAERLLEQAESLIQSDEDRSWWHAEKALQLIARYDDTAEMYRRAPFEEYEKALYHLEQHKKMVEGSGEALAPSINELYQHIKMGHDLRLRKRQERDARFSSVSEAKAKSGPCFVATAVYGSAIAPEVQALRHYRDTVLLRTSWGRSFVSIYDRIGPHAARTIEGRPLLKALVRGLLLKPALTFVRRCQQQFVRVRLSGSSCETPHCHRSERRGNAW